jgi:pilus assembly protein CpaF
MQTRPGSIEGNGEVTLRHLVREALRMRPERLVIGEVRQAECFDLLLALNSGQPGMATIHANSSREAILKLCTLPLLAGSNVTSGFVVPMVANAVDVIVHIARSKNGKRKVTSISQLTGKVINGLPEIVTRTMNTNLLKVS